MGSNAEITDISPKGEDKFKGVSLWRRDRAIKIQEMVERGAKRAEIAQYFNITVRTVYVDIQIAKQLNRESLKAHDQSEALGREIKYLLQLCRQAMRDYEGETGGNARVGYLRVALDARSKLQRLYLDTGMISNSGAGTPGTDPQQAMEQMLKISGSIDLSVLGEKEE